MNNLYFLLFWTKTEGFSKRMMVLKTFFFVRKLKVFPKRKLLWLLFANLKLRESQIENLLFSKLNKGESITGKFCYLLTVGLRCLNIKYWLQIISKSVVCFCTKTKKIGFFNKNIMVILGFDYNCLRRLKKHNLSADDL